MNAGTTVAELQRLILETLRCVSALQSMHGDTVALRRIANDAEQIRNGIDRLEIDLTDLTDEQHRSEVEMVRIPDVAYDADFWRDVDHEGVGAQSLACVPAGRRRR